MFDDNSIIDDVKDDISIDSGWFSFHKVFRMCTTKGSINTNIFDCIYCKTLKQCLKIIFWFDEIFNSEIPSETGSGSDTETVVEDIETADAQRDADKE